MRGLKAGWRSPCDIDDNEIRAATPIRLEANTIILRTPHPVTSRPHIALAMVPAAFGGLESSVLNLAKALLASDCRVTLMLSLPVGVRSPVEDSARMLGLEVVRIECTPRGYFNEYMAVRHEIRRLGIRVLHSHGYRADLVHGLAARHEGIGWASTFHGFTGGGRKNRLYEWLQVRAARRAGSSIGVSRAIVARLKREGVPAERCRLLHNAYPERTEFLTRDDARAELGLPSGERLVGWIGRLSHEKGPDTFVEACAVASSARWRGVIVGDGPIRVELEEMNRTTERDRQVLFCGFRANAARLLKAFDMIALSSRTEGTPITVLESMAAGVPVVAFPVGGVPELLSDSEAVLVPDCTATSLALAIESLLAQPELAATISAGAARRLAAEFSATRWARRHVEIYRDIIAGVGNHR